MEELKESYMMLRVGVASSTFKIDDGSICFQVPVFVSNEICCLDHRNHKYLPCIPVSYNA